MTDMLQAHSLQSTPPRKYFRRALWSILGAVLMIFVLTAVWIWIAIAVPVAHEEAAVTLEIASGMGVTEIAQELQQLGLIRSQLIFLVYTRVVGNASALKAGTYHIARSSSMREIVEQVVLGKAVSNDIRITIIEGWRAKEVKAYLKEKGLGVAQFDDIVSAGETEGSSSLIFQGKPASTSFEGYLFPDTYNVFPDTKSKEVIWKMINNFDSKITDEIAAQVVSSPYSFYAMLTLASIVEKEVRTTQERRIAAGIFLRRLEDNYPLESDATVNYITEKRVTRASSEDIQIPSAYNTYQRVGLPPTPICNPSLDAIQAVLNPEQSDYYFFLTTPDGTAVFSKTYEEHLQYKAQYYP